MPGASALLHAMINPQVASYEDVRNGIAPIAPYFASANDRLVVAFGGMALRREMPIFEFFATTSPLDLNKIFIRDLRRTWYHRGLPGICENIDGIAEYLRDLIGMREFRQITFVGSSTGGYAAILFGLLLNATSVIAFVPKTFLNPWQRLRHGDVKTWRQMCRLLMARSAQRKYFDLRSVLESRKSATEFHVHFCADSRLDVLHAEHLRGCANVFLHHHREGGHRLVRKLRDSGELKRILVASLTLDLERSAQRTDPVRMAI